MNEVEIKMRVLVLLVAGALLLAGSLLLADCWLLTHARLRPLVLAALPHMHTLLLSAWGSRAPTPSSTTPATHRDLATRLAISLIQVSGVIARTNKSAIGL